MSNLKDFIKKHEGEKFKVYDDEPGNPTIGAGFNLNSPDASNILGQMGLNRQELLQGKEITPEQSNELLDRKIDAHQVLLERLRQKDFPNSEIYPNEQDALDSLMYNSPKLIGPNMRQHLEANDDTEAAREIMLKSNRDKVPGIQKRRLEEAEMYAGDNFENVVESLSPEEITEVKNIIGQIKNPHTRMEIMKQFPFLKDVVPSSRFKKLRGGE